MEITGGLLVGCVDCKHSLPDDKLFESNKKSRQGMFIALFLQACKPWMTENGASDSRTRRCIVHAFSALGEGHCNVTEI